jgi:4-oxalocrotonate tautomerase
MPIVTVRVIDEITAEQKEVLIRELTELLHEVLVKDPERIYIVIDEVPLSNWAAGGYSVTQMRAQGKTGRCSCPKHAQASDDAYAEKGKRS